MCDRLGRGPGRPPLLHHSLPAIAAPTQAWSDPDGAMRDGAHGVHHAGVRWICGLSLTVDGRGVEPLSSVDHDGRVTFRGLVGGLDGARAEHRIVVHRTREA